MIQVPIEQLSNAERAVLFTLHLRAKQLDGKIIKEAISKRSKHLEDVERSLAEKGYIHTSGEYYNLTEEAKRLTAQFWDGAPKRRTFDSENAAPPAATVSNQFSVIWKARKFNSGGVTQ